MAIRVFAFKSRNLTALFGLVGVLAACGGSDSDSPPPAPTPAPYQAALVAGAAGLPSSSPNDPTSGCADGPALNAKFQPSAGTLARSASGVLLLAEMGNCDGRHRVRSIDPAGNTLKTLAIGAATTLTGQEPLTTFWTPTALAASPSGTVYVGDSLPFTGQIPDSSRNHPGRGPGVWKLDAAGNVTLLAGVALPAAQPGSFGVDGVGTSTSFGYIEKMCYGSDGKLYLNDNARLRTVTENGSVTTVTTPNVKQQAIVACGPDGSMLVRRWFNDAALDDLYDPIAQKSVSKIPSGDFFPLLYLGASNPSVVLPVDGSERGLATLNLQNGNKTLIAKSNESGSAPNLTSNPPVIVTPLAGVALNAIDFVTLSNSAVLRFSRTQK